MYRTDSEVLYDNILGTDIISTSEKLQIKIDAYVNDFSNYDDIKLNEQAKDKSLRDIFFLEREIIDDIQNVFSKNFIPTQIEYSFIKTRNTNIITNNRNNRKIIIIPVSWSKFYFGVLVYLRLLKRQYDDEIEMGNIYRNLLIYVDSMYCRNRLMPESVDKEFPENVFLLGNDAGTISDILYIMFAFIICHEISHIVLNHDDSDTKLFEHENEADITGYAMFLKWLSGMKEGKSKVSECFDFNEMFYNAPKLFFKICDMCNQYKKIVYGENSINNLYPTFIERNKNIEQIEKGKNIQWNRVCEKLDMKIDFHTFSLDNPLSINLEQAIVYFIRTTEIKSQAGKLDSIKRW
ncbi:MAG: hypothetical protein LBM77_03040 [Spirochaetaceae bacterium]|nr:hypothetical protein [Spirochaetaceae bacterium]